MKKLYFILASALFATTALLLSTAFAAPSKSNSPSTDVHFSGAEIRGKYQIADEAVAKVEREKIMRDLLHMRENFKDRMQNSVRGH